MTSAIRKIDASTVEVTVELGSSDLQGYVRKAEEMIAKSLNIEGFRNGKVSREAVRQRVGEAQLREEALQITVQESLSEAIEREGLDVLDQSNFAVKENTPEKLRYVLTITLYPNITLGNYRGIKVKKQTQEISDSERNRIRVELLHTVIANSTLHVPALMIDRQLDSMMANLDHQLHEQSMELGLYLAKIKKTQDELRNEWRAKAEDQVKMTLVLYAIGEAGKITVSPKELQEALELRLQQYMAGRQDAGTAEALKDLDLERVKQGLFGSLLNEKIFVFLESSAILIA